jgi:hypothetical protein
MDLKAAIDTQVRRRLEDSFGKAMAMMIWASATNKSGMSVHEPDSESFVRHVDAICSDPRCQDMWGKASCEANRTYWKSLA